MDKRQTEKHQKNLELLEALGRVMFPRGFIIINNGPDKLPGLSPQAEGAFAGPVYHININDPVIKELARRSIRAGIGGKPVNHKSVNFHVESNGFKRAEFEETSEGPSYPIFYDMHIWYFSFKAAKAYKILGYSRANIIHGFWQYLTEESNDFVFNCVESWLYPDSIKEITERPETYKAAKHLEQQKIGLVPKNNQLSLWDYWEEKGISGKEEEAKQIKIECVGLRNLTLGQYRAIEAVQKIISMTNFKGNIPGEYRKTDQFSGYVPAIEFTPAEYYEIRGVSKTKNKAGKWEFNRREREEALKDLEDLQKETFTFGLVRQYWKEGKKFIERIHTPEARLWTYNEHWRNLTEKENEALSVGGRGKAGNPKGHKITKIYLTNLSPIFIDQIENYFIIKPSRYRALEDCSSKFPFMFFDWLQIEADNRRAKHIADWVIEADRKDLAYRLELNALIKSRQTKRINKIILDCYELAIDEGMLVSFEADHQGATKVYDVLALNKEYFEKMGWTLTKPKE